MKNLDSVNQYIANLAMLNIKTHNFHFNIVGAGFKNIHEYLESIYNTYFDYYDAVAELVKMQGQMSTVSVADYLKITAIKEVPAKEYPIAEALEEVRKDMEIMRDAAVAIRKSADEEDNFLLANMMEDHLAYYAKQLWFIKATLAK